MTRAIEPAALTVVVEKPVLERGEENVKENGKKSGSTVV